MASARLAAGGVVALATLLGACSVDPGIASARPVEDGGPVPLSQKEMTLMAQTGPPDAGQVQISGTRITQGDAVECPKIRDEAGQVHSVSYLPPTIAIGALVSVRGQYRIMTTCLGRVVFVEEIVTNQ